MGNNNIKKNIQEKELKSKDIQLIHTFVKDSYSHLWLNDTFIAFKSINNIYLLIYATNDNSIISYDIIHNKKINELKIEYKAYTTSFRYYFDHFNNRDLFLSIISFKNLIKIWDANNFEWLLTIKNINDDGSLYSACFLEEYNNIYIITSNNSYSNSESIKILDFKGNKINEINDSNEKTFYIDTYYDKKISKTFIIACTEYYSKSYDYNSNEIYHKYSENDNNMPCHIIFNEKEEIVEMVESSFDGNIRIWNFHSGILLKKIKASNNALREICILDNEYLFVGCNIGAIKIVYYNNGNIIQEKRGHSEKVISLKKIFIPKYGNCLLSQGAKKDSIKLWLIKDQN